MAPRIATPTNYSDSSFGGSDTAALLVTAHQTTTTSRSPLHKQQQQEEQPQVRCHSDSSLRKCQSNSSFNSYTKPKRRISFDERVSVREFDSGSWNSVSDLQQYQQPPPPFYHGSTTSTGTTATSRYAVPRMILCRNEDNFSLNSNSNIHLGFSYEQPMTTMTNSTSSLHFSRGGANDDEDTMIFPLLRQEVRQVLVIDPHDIFLQIFSKRLQKALPHVRLLTAHSAEEALQMMDSSHAFDMIVTEERLSLFHRQQQHGQDNKPITSGSALLQHLQRYHAKLCSNALLVGVSAHWQIDHAKMEQSGADFCWKKVPTPDLSLSVLEELLYCLLEKRGKHELAKSLLHTGTPTVEEAVTPHPGSAKQ